MLVDLLTEPTDQGLSGYPEGTDHAYGAATFKVDFQDLRFDVASLLPSGYYLSVNRDNLRLLF
jgi:hypothetical protein